MDNTDNMRGVSAVSVSVRETHCLHCDLKIGPDQEFTASQARRHAGRHPGHVVVHTSSRETRYSRAVNGKTLPTAMLDSVRAGTLVDSPSEVPKS